MSVTTHDDSSQELPGQRPHFKVVSHSNLFYWWPVWSLGFIMAAISYFGDTRLAIVPEGTTVKAAADGGGRENFELRVPGKPTESLSYAATVPTGQEPFPHHITQSKVPGMVYTFVILLVILATSVTLRGLWSVVNLMGILLLALVVYILGWWGAIIEELGRLYFYTSVAGYFFSSLVLFVYWMMVVFVFDQRRFIIFSPGQIIVHREVGDQQKVYDTSGVAVVKRLNDFIRHRLLGLGSGDLIVTTADGRHEFELPNVLFADRKVHEIAETMKTRPVLTR
jgi:hypothetical protein